MKILASNTFKGDFNSWLKANALWLCIAIVAIIIATIIILFVFKNRNKGVKKEDNNISDSEWIEALGGKDNIKEVNAMGSRLTVVLENKDTINREKLTELGVSNIMVMSNKVTLIIEDKAEKTADKINKLLK